MDRKKLGQALVSTGKMTIEDFESAIEMHDKIGGEFASLLVKLDYVSEHDITCIIGKMEGIRTVNLNTIIIPKKLVRSFPKELIEKYGVIPISKKGNQITLAVSDAENYNIIEESQFLTGSKIEPVLASRESIKKAIIEFQEEEKTSAENLDKVIKQGGPKLQRALISILIEKNIITKEELVEKLKELY